MRVAESGFQANEIDNVVVIAGQPASANFQLALALARQVVEVAEGAMALQTQNADTTTTFNTRMIQNLSTAAGVRYNAGDDASGDRLSENGDG